MRKFLSILILGIVIFSCSTEEDETILFLVRHAEKDLTVDGDNPPLIEEGYQRAERLRDLLEKYEVKEVFSTSYDRNRNTIAPLVEAQNVPLSFYEWHEWHETIEDIKKQKGVFVLCGHGDNLLPIITYLNGELPMEEIGHDDYENLFKLIITADTTYVDLIHF